ncbi:MAG: hypothetical protein KC609_21305 [Myxococcales bacterium]|nr:hypothetical protein [Myxococcales bacterium]
MATYKLSVSKRFGKFYYTFHQATEQGKENADGLDQLDDVLKAVAKDFEGHVKSAEDSVIFRGIAYDSWNALKQVVRSSPF